MPTWIWTVLVLAMSAAMFFFARQKASQPSDPLNPRMIDYVLVQLICMIVGVTALTATIFLVMGNEAHMRHW